MILRLLHSIRVRRPGSAAYDELVSITDAQANLAEGPHGVTVTAGDESTFVPWAQVRSIEWPTNSRSGPSDTAGPEGNPTPADTRTSSPTPGKKRGPRNQSPPSS